MALPLSFDALGGGPLALGAPRAVLVVNTASACGATPQYAGLQALWQRLHPRGLQVVGVPCDDFGGQEPGDAAAIGAFCRGRYGVAFPLAAKAPIVGADRHPFYAALAAELGEDALPRWNFHKVLVDGAGELLGAWPTRVPPDDPELLAAVESALAGA